MLHQNERNNPSRRNNYFARASLARFPILSCPCGVVNRAVGTETLHIPSTPARLACSSCTSHPVFHGRWAWECSLEPALTLHRQTRGSPSLLRREASRFRLSGIIATNIDLKRRLLLFSCDLDWRRVARETLVSPNVYLINNFFF